MKKWLLAAIVVAVSVLGMLAGPVQGSGGFSVAPAKLEVSVSENGSSPVYVYLASSFDGELIIGMEDIPYRVEPASISVGSQDVNRQVELTIISDSAVETGKYPGKLTFLAYTGKNVAYGVKVDILVTQVENKGVIQKLIDRITGKNDDGASGLNYLIIAVVAIVVVAALMVGIVIGRRSRKSSSRHSGEQESTKNGEGE